MILTYEGCNLANYLISVIEDTCGETTQWTRHDIADSLPDELKSAIDPRYPVESWFTCRTGHQTLALVVSKAASDTRTFTLFGISEQRHATRLRKATEYPGSTDLLYILAKQVFECAQPDPNEATEQFISQVFQDVLEDLGDPIE